MLREQQRVAVAKATNRIYLLVGENAHTGAIDPFKKGICVAAIKVIEAVLIPGMTVTPLSEAMTELVAAVNAHLDYQKELDDLPY